jgi:CheY-like chemotaxis protein
MGDTETATDAIDVLMVEDNAGDARLAREAFDATDSQVRLTVVSDGASAIDRLLSEETALPSLVLLDLNLPGADGRTVLEACKSRPTLRRTPVVVFSSSDAPEDVCDVYDHHANAYVTKPRDADGFFDTIRQLTGFWFSAATLPEVCRS